MTSSVAEFVTRGRRRSERRQGTAEDGIFVPLARPVIAEVHPLNQSMSSGDGLRLADGQQFISGAEQDAYDHLTGLLLDTTISGVIRNEYIYLASSLNGEIVAVDGRVYDFSISDTFASFSTQATDTGSHAEGFQETDGEPLESSEIGRLFYRVSQELAVKEAWRTTSGLHPDSDIVFGTLDLSCEAGLRVIALPVETRFGEWSIELRGNPGAETLTYSLLDTDRGVTMTRRTTDAILSDIAEGCGKNPDPAEVLDAMIKVAAVIV